eukprot:1567492-Amphidinium_carterae.1
MIAILMRIGEPWNVNWYESFLTARSILNQGDGYEASSAGRPLTGKPVSLLRRTAPGQTSLYDLPD